jgi:hypothetical protein
MHNRQRDFLLLVILAAISMTSALGQGLASAVGPASSSTRSTASIPDFSGIWSNQSLNALEPPLSGPGPVRNRSRLRTGPQAGVGDGRQLARVAVSGSPHRRQANPRPRSQRMAGPPQQAPRQGQLAIQNRRRPRQAECTLSSGDSRD